MLLSVSWRMRSWYSGPVPHN